MMTTATTTPSFVRWPMEKQLSSLAAFWLAGLTLSVAFGLVIPSVIVVASLCYLFAAMVFGRDSTSRVIQLLFAVGLAPLSIVGFVYFIQGVAGTAVIIFTSGEFSTWPMIGVALGLIYCMQANLSLAVLMKKFSWKL
jgi:hypothetical protein